MKRTDVPIDAIWVGERPVSEQAVTMSESHRPVVIIPIDEIVSASSSQLEESALAPLMESIAQLGLLHPVGITRDGDVIFGRHRLAACRRLGWRTITAVIYDWDTLTAELAGIDENLCHRQQSAAEVVQALARRKQLYLALHPETGQGKTPGKKGGKGGKASGGKGGETPSFVEDTAQKTGRHKRTVAKDAALGAALPEEILDLLVGTKVTKKDLAALVKLDPQVQRSVAEMLSNGEVNTVMEALHTSGKGDGPIPAPEPSQVLLERLRPIVNKWMREFDSSPALAASVLQDFADVLLQGE